MYVSYLPEDYKLLNYFITLFTHSEEWYFYTFYNSCSNRKRNDNLCTIY